LGRETEKDKRVATSRRGPRRLIAAIALSFAVSQGKCRLIDLLWNDPEVAQILRRKPAESTNYLATSGAKVDRVLAGKGD
jgi:hypothetical protein